MLGNAVLTREGQRIVTVLLADEFANGVTLADGAWGTELDKLGCPPGFCRERWNVDSPDSVERVARSYVTSGSHIILTNTFGANRFVLEKHGCSEQVCAINRAGAEISKRAAGGRAWVFGSIGPSGKMVVTDEVSEDELFEAFKEQADALAQGGVEGLVVETMFDLIEAAAAVRAAKATGLLAVGSMTFDSGGDGTRTMMGVTPQQAVEALTSAGADIVGCNCGVGIDNYIKVAAMLRAATARPVWVKANAGLPEVRHGHVVYDMQPEEYANQVMRLVDAGASIVGGCCGTTPAFIDAIRRRLSAQPRP